MSSALAKRLKHGRYAKEAEQRRLEEEFLVIGYACTIFRDDEKAEFIDEERHLIKHQSDETVTTDRYDGRLYLHDVEVYDGINVARSADYNDGKSTDTDVDEAELEFERYRDLMAADDYDEDRIEPAASAGIGPPSEYHATESNGSTPASDDSKDQRSRRKEQPFVAPPELEIPSGLVVPETMQMHAIIAKTAAFIASKGSQMEIVIKAKQNTAKDGHFGFLEFDHSLRPYYDHVLAMIKKGRYQYVEEQEESESEDEEDGDYLHPSLRISASSSTAKKKEPEPQLPQVTQGTLTTADLMGIIDRLAEYVARNGDAFEDVVRSRKEPLYAFIEPNHEYNIHYRERVYFYRREYRRISQAQTTSTTAPTTTTVPVTTSIVPPVSIVTVDVSTFHSQRTSTASPSLSETKSDKKKKKAQQLHSPPKLTKSDKSKYSSRRSDDEYERDSSRKKRSRHSKRTISRSEDEGEDYKPKLSKVAAFVPLPPAKEETIGSSKKGVPENGDPSQGLDNVVEQSLGIANDQKNSDDSMKKIQEERRARAKIFLKLMRDREQNSSKIVNTGKPWDDD